MTNQNVDYYRMRIEEEMAAADQASDQTISNIHREMARRYRKLLGLDLPPVKASSESRTVFG